MYIWCHINDKQPYFLKIYYMIANMMLYNMMLCPSPTVPNLLPNEDESTIQVCSGGHFWSFQSIPIHSNSVLLMLVGSAGEYESFEHVQKLCVASANKFHSCLCVFVAQLTYCILVILTIFLLYSGCSYCILGHSYM